MGVEEHTIELAGSPVFYRWAPALGEPIVYLHGIPTSCDDWTPFLERIGGFAPDLLGFGRSGKGGHLDLSIDGHVRFLETLLAAFEIDAFELVVHDWGAVPGLLLAQRHPDRVRRLVTCNAIPVFDGFRWPRLVRLLQMPMIGELLMGSTSRRVLARTLRRGGAWSDRAVEEIWKQFDQGTQRAILRLYRDAREPRLAQAGANLGDVRAPCLVLWGERDPWLETDLGERYAQRVANATFERIPNAGHWPWRDDPAVVERISVFLERT